MKMKLTKDDYYEIEKILDIQSSMMVQMINNLATTCIHTEALGKPEKCLTKIFKDYQESYEHLKKIREKLEDMRGLK